MRIFGLVPARAGSRRVPGKNLKTIGGVSLVRRALNSALASGAFETLALSSDSDAILAEARGLDVVPVARPEALATDDARSFDVLMHALETIEAEHDVRYDAAAIIQCTTPFAIPEDFVLTVRLLETSGAGSAVSVVEVQGVRHPLKLKLMKGDRLFPWIEDDRMLPSQELPQLYARNGAIYVTKREILETGQLLSQDVRGYVMPQERSYEVDMPLEFAFAQFLHERAAAAS